MRVIKALTERAQEWIDDNVYCEDYQLCMGGIAGDWRMIDNIAEAMLDDDFMSSPRKRWQFWKPRNDFVVIVL